MIHRRTNWKEDRGLIELEILTCICCPDGEGFDFDGEEIVIDKPTCRWNTDGFPLVTFPLIPYWCPRMEIELDVEIHDTNPETFCHKHLVWQRLSAEAKAVLQVIFTLPEEFICRNKSIIRSLISKVIRETRDRQKPVISADKIYKELREFTWNFLH